MLKPLADRVIIKAEKETEKNVGGIILTSNHQEQVKVGTVVAVGKGRVSEDGQCIPMEVNVNDTVMFESYAGSKIQHDGEEYVVMHEKDIMAIVTED